MAVSRYARNGKRARSAAQRAALKKAQIASARKRRVGRRVVVGTGAVLVAGGAAYSLRNTKAGKETKIAARRHFKTVKSIPSAPKRLRAKIQTFPYEKDTGKFAGQRSVIKANNKEIRRLTKKAERIARNKARAHTPAQRAEAQKRRASYLDAYNRRRREAYRQHSSVGHGVRPRKKRAKETQPRKRKTD